MNLKKLLAERYVLILQILAACILIGIFSLGISNYLISLEPKIETDIYLFIIDRLNPLILMSLATYVLIKLWKINFRHNHISAKMFVIITLISISTFFLINILDFTHFVKTLRDNALVFDIFKIRKPIGPIHLYYTDLLASIVIGPLVEEMLYRKLIFNKLKSQFSVMFSIIFTSILFSAMHLRLNSFMFILIVGVILNYVYYLTDNLLLNIIFHSLLNVMFYLFERSEIAFSHRAILMCVCFYIICGVTLYQSLKYLKIQKMKNENG